MPYMVDPLNPGEFADIREPDARAAFGRDTGAGDGDSGFDGTTGEPFDKERVAAWPALAEAPVTGVVLPSAGAAAAAAPATIEGPAPTPTCPYCGEPSNLVGGDVIYPHRPDLAERWFWLCAPCDAYVGTQKGTQLPLGTPAKPDLRRARWLLHDLMLDPLWKTAPECGAYDHALGDARARKHIEKSARHRVYSFLAHKLGLSVDETHTAMFTIEKCRAAWRALRGVRFLEIRDWYKQQRGPVDTRPPKSTAEETAPRPAGPSRNKPCPCGSGVNYKRCCAQDAVAKRPTAGVPATEMESSKHEPPDGP